MASSNPNIHLSFGLNKRTDTSSTKPSFKKTSTTKQNIFAADDDSSDDDEKQKSQHTNKKTQRHAVNAEIAAEQRAIRKRAEQALASSMDNTIYDYDEAYDAEQSKRKEEEERAELAKKQQKNQGSRYIGKLLQTAKVRQMENEMVYERKLAREQAAEEENEDFQGKEKFVTKAYKRKLEEREAWKRADEEKGRQEAREDVTKRGAGAMAGFYGNLGNNIAMGGTAAVSNNQNNGNGQRLSGPDDDAGTETERKKINLDGGKTTGDDSTNNAATEEAPQYKSGSRIVIMKEDDGKAAAPSKEDAAADEEMKRKLKKAAERSLRAEKVAAARERYFIRHVINPAVQ